MTARGDTGAGDALLEIRGLHVEARGDRAWNGILRDIDLTLHRGEVVGLIGESGAGKSTIGLAALGFARDGTRFAAGSVKFEGRELTTASERELHRLRGLRIAYVAQSAAAALNPAYRLISQYCEIPVARGIHSREQAEAEAKKTYRTLLLPDAERIGYRFPHQVSGGQLQRAMMAMAMACRPELIVFDEPTTALDVTTQVEVLAAIKVIVEQFNTAALYITHDLAVVAQMADRIMVLRHGRMVEMGSTRELLKAPQQDYTRSLLSVHASAKESHPEPTGQEPVLSVQNVSAAYGHTVVLDDVSLDLYRQRTMAVVGESGSGKTSLARVISGLLTPSHGRVLLDGNPLPPRLRERRKEQLKQVQMIYQSADTALNPRQKVGDILERPLEFYLNLQGPAKHERASELLAMIDLPAEFAHRYPNELSGGEKQRVCIARALAADPAVVICDEVTSALDQLVAQEILMLLQRLQNELAVSFLFITHDLVTVKAIADEVVVMQSGRVLEAGSRAEVLSPPHHPYTELLLSSVPQMDPDWLDERLAARYHAAAPDAAVTTGS